MSHINKKITLTLSFNPDKKIEKCQITLKDLALLDERSGISLFWPISFSRYKYIILQSFNPSFFLPVILKHIARRIILTTGLLSAVSLKRN